MLEKTWKLADCDSLPNLIRDTTGTMSCSYNAHSVEKNTAYYFFLLAVKNGWPQKAVEWERRNVGGYGSGLKAVLLGCDNQSVDSYIYLTKVRPNAALPYLPCWRRGPSWRSSSLSLHATFYFLLQNLSRSCYQLTPYAWESSIRLDWRRLPSPSSRNVPE